MSATEEVKPQAKTYTERFLEMERTLGKMATVINFQGKVLQNLMNTADRMNNKIGEFDMVRKTVNAMIKNAEREKLDAFSMDSLAKTLADLEFETTKNQLTEDVKSGNATAVEEVGPLSVIEFVENDDERNRGFFSVYTMDEESKKTALGKKNGDLIGTMKIVGIYNYKVKAEEEASVNEQ